MRGEDRYRVSYARRGIGLVMRGEDRYRVSYERRGEL